jgi:hypothetical protein
MATKKVKSFNVDEAAYKSMVALLKEYGTEASISFFLDKCLKELLHYFQTMQDALADSDERKEIMRFVIGRMAGSVLIHTPDGGTPGEGEPGLNRISTKTIEPQILWAKAIEDMEPDVNQTRLPEIQESALAEEVHYWRDEYEANKKKLSRAFVKHLRSGKFLLSPDRKYLLNKETGKRYVDFCPNYIVEISPSTIEK